MKIFNLFRKKTKDELLGIWHKEDDGTGLINFWGWSLEFKEDGTGLSKYWDDIAFDDENDNLFERFESQIFLWKRIDKATIQMKFESSLKSWDTISYKITYFKGSYGTIYKKLIELDSEKEQFWNSIEALYQQK